jgi:HEAT repeat protein
MAAPKEIKDMDFDELIVVFERESEFEDGWADWNLETAAAVIAQRGESGIRFLLECLPTADTAHTEAALSAMGDLEPAPPEAREFMLRGLNDARPPVLYAAIHALQRQGIREPLPQIEPLVDHDSSMVRSAAMKFLARLYPEIAIKYIALLHADPSWIVRDRVLTELEDTQDERLRELAVPCALKSLDDPHPYVREDAAMLLEDRYWSSLTSQDLIAGLASPDPRIRASAPRVSAHNSLDKASATISEALEDPERIVRINALDELFEIYRDNRNESLPGLPDVSRWLTDDDPVIREAAEAAAAGSEGNHGYYVHKFSRLEPTSGSEPGT